MTTLEYAVSGAAIGMTVAPIALTGMQVQDVAGAVCWMAVAWALGGLLGAMMGCAIGSVVKKRRRNRKQSEPPPK